MEMVPATLDVECHFSFTIHKFVITWEKITEVIPLTCDQFKIPFDKQQSLIFKNENCFILWNDLIMTKFILPQCQNDPIEMEKYRAYQEHLSYPEYIRVSIKTMRPNNSNVIIPNYNIPNFLYLGMQKILDEGELKSDEDKSFHGTTVQKGKVPLYYNVELAFEYPCVTVNKIPKLLLLSKEPPKFTGRKYHLRRRNH